MQITQRNVELRVDDSLMRVYVAAPKPPGQYPGILFYSDIYQLGGAMTRLVNYPSSVTLRDTQIVQELNHPET